MSAVQRLRRHDSRAARAAAVALSVVDPRPWLHLLRLVHYVNATHLDELRRATTGPGTRIAPNASFSNGERITIGRGTHVNSHSCIWAGREHGRVDIGADCLLGPRVFVTAANYGTDAGARILDQPRRDADVRIGDDCWLGAGAVVLPGVQIGDGCVVGAGAVVTRSLPPGSVAVGVPARVVARRGATAPALTAVDA